MIMLALSISYIFAVTLTPILSKHFLRPQKRDTAEHGYLARFADRLARFTTTYAKSMLALGILAIFLSFFCMRFLDQEFFPNADRPRVIVELYMPEGTDQARTAEAAASLEQAILTQADALMWELGINFDAETPPPSQDLLPSPPRQAQGGAPMPSMVVFDLDFTLWKPELYQLSSGPPFTQSADGCVLTRRGERLDLFAAARKALSALADAGVPVAIASRASEPVAQPVLISAERR